MRETRRLFSARQAVASQTVNVAHQRHQRHGHPGAVNVHCAHNGAWIGAVGFGGASGQSAAEATGVPMNELFTGKGKIFLLRNNSIYAATSTNASCARHNGSLASPRNRHALHAICCPYNPSTREILSPAISLLLAETTHTHSTGCETKHPGRVMRRLAKKRPYGSEFGWPSGKKHARPCRAFSPSRTAATPRLADAGRGEITVPL